MGIKPFKPVLPINCQLRSALCGCFVSENCPVSWFVDLREFEPFPFIHPLGFPLVVKVMEKLGKQQKLLDGIVSAGRMRGGHLPAMMLPCTDHTCGQGKPGAMQRHLPYSSRRITSAPSSSQNSYGN